MRNTGQSAAEFISSNAALLVLIILLVAALFYLGVANAGITVRSCHFIGYFSCISYSVSELDGLLLEVGQTTGSSITVTSVSCSAAAPHHFQPLASPVRIDHGAAGTVSGGDSGNYILCNGGARPTRGSLYRGTVCLAYTEAMTNVNKTACGEIITRIA